MLVSAFSGLDTIKAAYAHAIEHGYRFYSYGDACLLSPAIETVGMDENPEATELSLSPFGERVGVRG
jgi:hypothetical protein